MKFVIQAVTACALVSCSGVALAQGLVPFGNFTEGGVWDLHVHNDELYLAGRNGSVSAGLGALVRRWDGSQWVWVGNQLLVEQPQAQALDLATHNGELHVVGRFDDGTLRQAARWDGTAWRPVGDGLGTYGWKTESFDGKLWAIAVSSTPQMVLTFSLKVLENGQWSTPAGWSGGEPYSLNVVNGVFYIGMRNGELRRYQAGSFVSEGVVGRGRVGPVIKHEGVLHAGVTSGDVGNSAPVEPVARRVNGRWLPLRMNVATLPTFVSSLSSFDGELHIFGQQVATGLPLPGQTFLSSAARWLPGVQLHSGSASDSAAVSRASVTWQGALYVGLDVITPGASSTVLRYTGSADPVIITQPQDLAISCDGSPRATQVRVSGPGVLTVYREDVDLGTLSGGVAAVASNGNAVDVAVPAAQTVNGRFRLVVVSASGSTRSDAFTIRGIDIDFNNNFVFPEDQDVIDFLNALAGGDCVGGPFAACDSIDINANGVYPEDADVVAFFTNLAGGCE